MEDPVVVLYASTAALEPCNKIEGTIILHDWLLALKIINKVI